MDETPAPTGRTFTLRDLLVVFVVVAIAMSFIVAVLNARREAYGSSARGYCRQNVLQLTLALQNHSETYKVFPPLYFSNDPTIRENPPLNPTDAAGCYSLQTRLLPFLEEDKLYNSIKTASGRFTLPPNQVKIPSLQTNKLISPGEQSLRHLICPSTPGDTDHGVCNYVAISATRLPLFTDTQIVRQNPHEVQNEPRFGPKFKPDGMIIPDKMMRGQSMARMADGASKTAVLIESREELRSNWFDVRQGFVVGFLPADSTPIDAAASNYYPYFTFTEPVLGQTTPEPTWHTNPAAGNRTALNFGPTSAQPNNAYHGLNGDPLERTWGPSSAHLGGIILVGMGDGSVQELKDDIDPKVFFSIITARGGEPYDVPVD